MSFRNSSRQKLDKSDLLWLAYLIFFLLEPLARRSGRYWLQCLGLLAVFLGLYFAFLFASSARLRRGLAAAVFALGVATMPLNEPGGCCFLIYAASLFSYAISSVPLAIGLTVLDVAVMALEGWWLHFPVSAIVSTCFFAFIAAGANLVYAQKERDNCKLRMKQEEVEALAAVAERERIARDLHDVLGHTLSLIVLKAELAGRLLDSGTPAAALRARAELADVETTARTALAEVREAIGGYRARGLGAEIEAARRTLDTAGVRLSADAAPAQGLSAAEETVLALALREAVTNIVRHARASTCRVRFLSEHGLHRLVVEDDGRNAGESEGNGLRGMRERVESLGGTLQLVCEHGTRLLIELPDGALPPRAALHAAGIHTTEPVAS